MAYALHRLPAVASIILTQEYLEFAQHVMASHDKVDKQAELDVSASMGEMLQDMQDCLFVVVCLLLFEATVWQLSNWGPRSGG